ncbi:MAG: Gx transporter family protein [Oscillospiraceae bacterium]|nr:Gx transporter family protein [Candidatus Equicaccousia limihippi]
MMTKKISLYASFLILSLGFSYAESFIPAGFLFPGFKPGFANLVPLTLIIYGQPLAALMINIARILLSALLFGSVSALPFSLAGACGSFLIMWLLCKTEKFSPVGLSLAGGVTHNIFQVCVSLIFLPISVFRFICIFIALGAVTGTVMGILCNTVIGRFDRFLKVIKREKEIQNENQTL